MAMERRLLIAGFEPFGGESINPAWEAVQRLEASIGGFVLQKLRIPTVFGEAAEAVMKAAREFHPDVILCVGQAGTRAAVTPERIGINIRSARIADNAGNQPIEEPIIPGGPDGLFATVAVEAMAEAIRRTGLKGEVSNSAGTFVCNDTLYTLLHAYQGTPVQVGFIHVPFLPEQGQPNMELTDMVRALRAAILAINLTKTMNNDNLKKTKGGITMENKVILFQGDSITDCGRSRENDKHFGCGYPCLVSAKLAADYPYQYTFYNRGISGNRIVDLYARSKAEIVNLKPDYLSILIGINDVWHELWTQNGVEAEKFEKVYAMLIEELQQALPNLKIMILEPFVLPGEATVSTEAEPDRWEYFEKETALRAAAAKRVAEKYGLTFVPLQEQFNQANADAPFMGYWLRDGVHPSPAGHELIKNAWLKAFETL